MATVEERVAAGAAWLDEKRPGWERKIDLAVLDITDGCRCILGQVYPRRGELTGFGVGVGEAIADDLNWNSDRHGFLGCAMSETDALDEAWIALLKERFDTGNLSDEA